MILFKAEHVQPILDRVKTQTRRLGKKRWNVGAVHQCKTNYVRPCFARVRIKRVWQERLGAISHADANTEGYRNAHEYLLAFHEINRVPLVAETRVKIENSLVWVVDLELVSDVEVNDG